MVTKIRGCAYSMRVLFLWLNLCHAHCKLSLAYACKVKNTLAFIVTPYLHRMRAAPQNTIELIIISDAVYTGCDAAWQIIDCKLLPRSFLNEVLTQIANKFQRSFCCVQCRPTQAGAARHPVYTRCKIVLFRRCFPLLFFIRNHYIFLSSLG